MKRNRFSSRKRISADATEVGRLAIGLAESGSKLEDLFWQKRLAELVDRMLHDGAEEDLNASLDRLFDTHAMAHDDLADIVESQAESCIMLDRGQDFDVLLIAVPVLGLVALLDSRDGDSAGPPADLEGPARGARVCRRCPRRAGRLPLQPGPAAAQFCRYLATAAKLGAAALAGCDLSVDAASMPETNRFLSDTRYVIGALAVPRGLPLFRWNEEDKSTRETALKEWLRQGAPCFEPLLTGCAYQPLLADAYHAACRAADSASRPYSLNASVAFLQSDTW
jgi:hypothetical protein